MCIINQLWICGYYVSICLYYVSINKQCVANCIWPRHELNDYLISGVKAVHFTVSMQKKTKNVERVHVYNSVMLPFLFMWFKGRLSGSVWFPKTVNVFSPSSSSPSCKQRLWSFMMGHVFSRSVGRFSSLCFIDFFFFFFFQMSADMMSYRNHLRCL